jgi:lysophospholipase L1-like esterase
MNVMVNAGRLADDRAWQYVYVGRYDGDPGIGSFAALGDSFTEGIDDPRPDGAGYRGWADRFAEQLALYHPELRYANLAVRGKMVSEVADEQLPRAIEMAPDLVSIAAGGNDLLRPRSDPDTVAELFDSVVGKLRDAGCRVMLFTGFDPYTFPVIRLIRGRVAAYNMHLRAIADRRQCDLVDLWSMRVLRDPRAWSADRLHLTADGHRRVALRACEVIGVPVQEDWREPLPSDAGAALPAISVWLAARRLDARWAREHAAPWVGRRLRRASSGDGVLPKRPELLRLS